MKALIVAFLLLSLSIASSSAPLVGGQDMAPINGATMTWTGTSVFAGNTYVAPSLIVGSTSPISNFSIIFSSLTAAYDNRRVYVSTVATSFIVPQGIYRIYVKAWGSGGGGAATGGGGAGGGGSFAAGYINTAPGTQYTVFVGSGGTGGKASANFGQGGAGLSSTSGGSGGTTGAKAGAGSLGGGGGGASGLFLITTSTTGLIVAAGGGGGGGGGSVGAAVTLDPAAPCATGCSGTANGSNGSAGATNGGGGGGGGGGYSIGGSGGAGGTGTNGGISGYAGDSHGETIILGSSQTSANMGDVDYNPGAGGFTGYGGGGGAAANGGQNGAVLIYYNNPYVLAVSTSPGNPVLAVNSTGTIIMNSSIAGQFGTVAGSTFNVLGVTNVPTSIQTYYYSSFNAATSTMVVSLASVRQPFEADISSIPIGIEYECLITAASDLFVSVDSDTQGNYYGMGGVVTTTPGYSLRYAAGDNFVDTCGNSQIQANGGLAKGRFRVETRPGNNNNVQISSEWATCETGTTQGPSQSVFFQEHRGTQVPQTLFFSLSSTARSSPPTRVGTASWCRFEVFREGVGYRGH